MDMRTVRALPNYAGKRGLVGHQPKNEADEIRGYTESNFAGHVYYKCCYCPFDTMKKADAVIHVHRSHYLDPNALQLSGTRPAQAMLFDPSGRMVTDIPVSPGDPEVPLEEHLTDPDGIIDEAFVDLVQEGKL